MMNVAICENDEYQLKILSQTIKEWSQEKELNINIDEYKSGESFLFSGKEIDVYDVIFLDIEMNKISGIELSNIIREKNQSVDIVFVTGLFKYALYGYKVKALQYLIKPFNKLDLFKCLEDVLEKKNSNIEKSDFVTITTGKKVIKLKCDDIHYCVMFSPYVDIYTKTGKITIRKKISDLEKILPEDKFIRSHRSYIVNLTYINLISKDSITLYNGEVIPISRGKYDMVNLKYINYFC